MFEEPIPGVVRRLLAEHIDSVPEVEAVLLLREDPTRQWTSDEAGKRLYVSTVVAAHLLGQLAERGFLVEVGDGYRYEPESSELRDAVDQLASAYSRHLVAVTQIIHSKPSQHVRDFAQAFRLRKPRS